MNNTSSTHSIHVGVLTRKRLRATSKNGLLSMMKLAALIAGSLALLVPAASADAPPGPYFN